MKYLFESIPNRENVTRDAYDEKDAAIVVKTLKTHNSNNPAEIELRITKAKKSFNLSYDELMNLQEGDVLERVS